ncbi:hypothetical protein RJ641_033477 [Dillenia turbinata]|uniref:Uncharacterized protein n=1 Tax=Dillenia turbinata TaxID=194707 RepID=A0AAN8VZQ1_9MAGN
MASTSLTHFSLSSLPYVAPSYFTAFSLLLHHPTIPTRWSKAKIMYCAGGDLLGDFGARDPFPAEIESNFGEKVLGAWSTEHKILIPKLTALSLAQLDSSPASPLQPLMSEDDAFQLLRKVVGWRLLDEDEVAEAAEHFPNLHLEQPNQVRAELWTASIGG